MSRRRKGERGRFPKKVTIKKEVVIDRFVPFIKGKGMFRAGVVEIDRAELEALRLADMMGMYQEEIAVSMGVSRGTVWRLLESAHAKVADVLTNGKMLVVEKYFDQRSECPREIYKPNFEGEFVTERSDEQ